MPGHGGSQPQETLEQMGPSAGARDKSRERTFAFGYLVFKFGPVGVKEKRSTTMDDLFKGA